MEKEMKLQHFSHIHPLIFTKRQVNEGEDINCSGCEKAVLGPSYNCCKCKFSLHEICAKLPFKINHPFHRNHPLILLSKPPTQYTECLCDFCDKTCNSFVYHCFTCRFDLDIPCALLQPQVTGDFLELERFSHKHQLIFIENHVNQGKEVSCSGCKDMVSGPSYSCSNCEFFLHRKCYMLAPEINHPYHREHSLILLTNLPPSYSSCVCDFCLKTCQGFVYHCPSCKFDLDIECAFLPLCITEPESHRHRFIHLMKALSFICDACGVKGDHHPYLCTVCQVIVHEECRFLPHTIKIIGHRHPVTQFYFLQGSKYSKQHCGICHNEVSSNYGGYGCLGCNFVAHVNCATVNSVSMDATLLKSQGQDENIIFRSDDSSNLITDIIKEINLEGDMVAMVVKHFSHPHKLTLNEKVNDDKLCDCCITPILEPFYSCLECDLFLHKTCLQLPKRKQHPLHPHPLTLLSNHPNFEGLFFCDACHQSCHGFTYNGDPCNFNLDVRCGSSSNTLKHEAHEHPLIFSKGTECIDCSACGYGNDYLYSCFDCSFALDFNCASLPHTVRHRHHGHPLDLTYQDSADQNYCNICEEERNPKHWFYCCKTCNFYAHPKCATGQYPYIKLGKTYPYEAHPHRVAFVHKTRSHPPCSRSGNPCKGLALECTKPQCNFIIEWCHVEILHF
ncbi:PREDICTED: uncharacterized protein LOC18599369 [Theobroma cacao]|uniref:Uncharacterized protein LOC18599369 n=1 Tax=Theobroma cacao TaxID=3641 RepID=A0AB32V3T6_THECC|nr:PREDICTED: uncharacterized protein LOC18599369 [Theobroma cacao]